MLGGWVWDILIVVGLMEVLVGGGVVGFVEWVKRRECGGRLICFKLEVYINW